MINKKGVIISGFGGVGKTVLGKKYKNVIDLESSPFKYNYKDYDEYNYEALKGQRGRLRNKNYPGNYIDAILKAIDEYDIVCVRSNGDEEVDFYDTYELDYIACCPTKSAYKKYAKRFEERGNSKEWITKNKKYFIVTYNRCKKMKDKVIWLHDDETLEDALKKINYKLFQNKNIILATNLWSVFISSNHL